MAATAQQATSQQRGAEPSMEEILASIRKIIAEDQKALDGKADDVALPLEAAPAVNDDNADVLDLASLTPVEPVTEPLRHAAPAVEPAYSATAAAAAVPPADRLISDTTAQTTSAAFHSLANAVFTQQARTMDDLVTEMLKPMLTAWLDDHLPSLVERLVKAEIERVARGGR